MYLWNAATKTMTLISKHDGVATYEPATFDPASQWLYYLTNDGSEFTRVRRYELATGKTEDVEKADWDVAWTFFSHNGKYRVSGVNQDGRTVLKIYDGKTGAPVALPAFPSGEISVGAHLAQRDAGSPSSSTATAAPTTSTCYEFGAKAPVRLTDTMSKDIDPEDLVEAAGRALPVLRRHGDPEHLLQALPGDRRRPRRRRSSGCTAGRAARRAASTAPPSSTSSTTAT